MGRKSSIKQYAKALYEATKDAPDAAIGGIVNNFLSILERDNKLKKIEYIIDEFTAYSKMAEGIMQIEVESARKLDAGAAEKIRKIFGAKSEIRETVNKKLIGGLRIKINDIILDASVKNQLNRLKNSLTK